MSNVQKFFYQQNNITFPMYLVLSIVTLGWYTVYYHYKLIEQFKQDGFKTAAKLKKTWETTLIFLLINGVMNIVIRVIDFEDANPYSVLLLITVCFVIWGISSVMQYILARDAAELVKRHTEHLCDSAPEYNRFLLFFFPGLSLSSYVNKACDHAEYKQNGGPQF